MIERLFLDGVDIGGDGFTEDMGVEYSASVLAHPADPEFVLGYFAVVAAEEAMDAIIFLTFNLFVEYGLFKHIASSFDDVGTE